MCTIVANTKGQSLTFVGVIAQQAYKVVTQSYLRG